MEVLVIPTERKGTVLRTVTETEVKAWRMEQRFFEHAGRVIPPDDKRAPDHNLFKIEWQSWKKLQDEQLSFGIWDKAQFGKLIFPGFVTIKPYPAIENAAEVGCTIAEKYQRLGFAGLALSAVMKYGRENLDYETMVAETLPKNWASRGLVEKMGYTLLKENSRRAVYIQPLEQPSESTA